MFEPSPDAPSASNSVSRVYDIMSTRTCISEWFHYTLRLKCWSAKSSGFYALLCGAWACSLVNTPSTF